MVRRYTHYQTGDMTPKPLSDAGTCRASSRPFMPFIHHLFDGVFFSWWHSYWIAGDVERTSIRVQVFADMPADCSNSARSSAADLLVG